MAIDSQAFRQTVGQFATGVAVIAIEIDGTLRALTANSFTSVSLEPPLVLFCIGKQTRAGRAIHQATGFSVNILRHDQQDLSAYFAGVWKDDTPPPFTFIEWEGGPRLDGATASLGCRIHAVHDGGDHWIVVGEVIALHRAVLPSPPLVFYGGRYVRLAVADREGEEALFVAWSGPLG